MIALAVPDKLLWAFKLSSKTQNYTNTVLLGVTERVNKSMFPGVSEMLEAEKLIIFGPVPGMQT